MEKYWVAHKDEIIEGSCKLVKVKNVEYGIYNVRGTFYAWRNACPHYGAPVCKGVITGTRLPSAVYEYTLGRENEIVRCPWHGWEFDLITGEHLVDPETKLRPGKLVDGSEETRSEESGCDTAGCKESGSEQERLEKAELELQENDLYIWL